MSCNSGNTTSSTDCGAVMTEYDFCMTEATTRVLEFQWISETLEDGTEVPVDLTGFTAEIFVKKRYRDDTVLFTQYGTITPEEGRIVFNIAANVTQDGGELYNTRPQRYKYRVTLTELATGRVFSFAQGNLEVKL